MSHDISATNIIPTNIGFMINIANANNEGTYTCTASNIVGVTELIYNVRVGCKLFNSVLFNYIFPIVLPQLTLTLTIRFSTTSVIIEGVFTDSSPQNVHTFYVFVDSQVYKLDLSLLLDRHIQLL